MDLRQRSRGQVGHVSKDGLPVFSVKVAVSALLELINEFELSPALTSKPLNPEILNHYLNP